jgi:hypothetical protein
MMEFRNQILETLEIVSEAGALADRPCPNTLLSMGGICASRSNRRRACRATYSCSRPVNWNGSRPMSVASPSEARRGAIENWGGITFFESRLLFDPAASAADARRGIFSVLARTGGLTTTNRSAG